MKLLENISELGDSVHDAIAAMIKEMFNEALEEAEIAEIVNSLKLSDILMLDQAYTNNDKEAVSKILGNDLVEYSIGQGRQTTSSAAERPQVTKRTTPSAAPTDNNKSNSSNYSGGVQSGVTTQHTDNADNTTPDVSDDEEIEEEETLTNPAISNNMNVTSNHYVTIKELKRLSGIN